jgi:ribosomal protein L35AE/L33A
MTKGTVVYISGAAGNKAVVSRAIATGDPTSAQTMGIITANISNNQNGYATVFGQLVGLNTSAFAEGAQLYLSSTVAGGYTDVKQYAPNHLVYVAIVTRSHQNQGAIEVRIQNGYEMDELHDVSARSPANNDLLKFNSSTNLWEKYQGASGSFTTVDLKTITVVGGLITSIA